MTEQWQPKPDDWDEELDGEWDGNFDPAEGEEIELIISYLNGHLDPAAAAAVKRRLEEDEKFYELAWPLLLTWSIPKHIERHPRPPGEFERDWEEFKRRSGYPNRSPQPPQPPQPPPSRWQRVRSWLYQRMLAVVVVGAVLFSMGLALSFLDR